MLRINYKNEGKIVVQYFHSIFYKTKLVR